MIKLRRRWSGEVQPIAVRLRRLVYLVWALILLVCATAVGALQIQANESDRVIATIGPAVVANGQVLQVMTDAETGLRGYEISNVPAMLGPYRGAHLRTEAALSLVERKLVLGTHDGTDAALYRRLQEKQRRTVERWWTHALIAEQAMRQGQSASALTSRVLAGRVLFDAFREANAALGKNLGVDLGQAQTAAETASVAGTATSIAATLAALVLALVLGRRAARSMSQPLTELRDTVARQRQGEPGARAREDQGFLEARSLSADFNALSEQNLVLRKIQEHALSMHQLTFEIERGIRNAPDTRHALEFLCAALGEGLGADRVMTNTLDSNDKVVARSQWHLPQVAPVGSMPEELSALVASIAQNLWLSSSLVTRNDVLGPESQFPEEAKIFHRATGARAVIMVPIGLGDRVIGMIYVIMLNGPRAWTESEANVVQQVASFVARVVVESEYRVLQSEYVDRLERLDRQKTDFLSTVSHELRTPLTSISGYLELLQDGDAGAHTDEAQRMLEVMERNTNRLRALIEDLLVLNRIESDGQGASGSQVSMRELITHCGQELSPLAGSDGIELAIDAGPEEATVHGDSGRLYRAVVNIVSNAIKFSPAGRVVTINCTVDHESRRVLFTCQDRGIGIPTEDQAHLFTRFYRASNAQDQAIPGTGLGLSIVKQIVEDHGGELRLSSVEGEGTTIVMDLPLSGSDQTPGA